MNASQPPVAPSNQPSVVQQTTVIQVGSQKSVGLAVLLALFFGPLGMLYATVAGALVMLVVDLLVSVVTLGLGLLLTIPLGAIWAGAAASSHNKGLGVATQSVAGAAAQSPAGWHPDPDGGGRLRYWDGQRWTEHYSDNPDGAEEKEPAQLVAASTVDGPMDEVKCESCDEQIVAGHRFCGSCGAPRPAST
jgi:Protein of unknown function (DUF2510)